MPRPPEHGQLEATGKDGQKVIFHYTCEEDTHLSGETGYESQLKWCFCIVEENDVFNFDLVDEGGFMRVEMMNRNGCERYKARGITEAFIRLSSQIFGVPICSSTRARPRPSSSGIASVAEQHSDAARTVWQTLVAGNEAYYDNDQQRFIFPPAHR